MALIHILVVFIGGLLGIIGYVGLPWIIGERAPLGFRSKLAQHYWGMMAVAMDRMLLVIRKRTGVDLCASRHDAEMGGGEAVELEDRQRNYEDPGGKMAYFKNRPLGIVTDTLNVVLDPLTAEVGRQKRDRRDAGEEWVDLNSIDDINAEGEAYAAHYRVPETPRGVDIEDAIEYVDRAAPPESADATYERVRLSQIPFKDVNMLEIMSLALLYLVGLGGIYMVADFLGGSGGGGGTSVSLTITHALGVLL